MPDIKPNSATKKRVLFVINSFGMGNAVRCCALIENLPPEWQADVITSDKAYDYFEGRPEVAKLYKQHDINSFKSKQPYGTFLFFISYALFFLMRILRNYSLQKKIIRENSYDLLFFDSDYSFVLHRLFSNRKIVGINNAAEVVYFYKNRPELITKDIRASLILERLDHFSHSVFAHSILCPAVSPEALKKEKLSLKIQVVPLLVRRQLAQTHSAPGSGHGVLILASSSGAASAISLITDELRKENTPFSDVFLKDNVTQLKNCRQILCNAGQSSLAECLYLNKPSLVVPIPRHAEQKANAYLVENFGLFRYTGLSPQETLSAFYKHFSENKISQDNGYTYEKLTTAIKDYFTKLPTQL